ncbi:hypothetical protein JOE44_001967 [Chryseobacterium sp. PvR013]|uniref:hypothetical protein n=1 Tax=Chryseobacterium sp. PvR013 TaxID=2806595 RepID=UPI001AE1B94A|nr:hypothetical protein [Chryseobacterium sp. PvR013]MBP1165083.1 hypothetical protein [Chryseobacterium sp. PvR013]
MAKTSAQSETEFLSTDKSRKIPIKLEFKRLGEKGAKRTKEYFWLDAQGALTLDDLKKIVENAELLIKVADDEI